MAGVRDEPAHPLLGLVRRRLGLLPGVECGLDLAQHRIQRPAEAADLGARVTLRHPPVQVTVRDLSRRLLDVHQRPQVRLHDREPDDRQHEHDHDADDEVGADQLPQGGVLATHVDPR